MLARRARQGTASCATGRAACCPLQTVQPTIWEEPEALARRARPGTASWATGRSACSPLQTVQQTIWEELDVLPAARVLGPRHARLGGLPAALGKVQLAIWEEPEVLASRARPQTASCTTGRSACSP